MREPSEGGIVLSSPNTLPPSYRFLSVVCSSFLICRRAFPPSPPFLSFVIQKRNEEDTRPSSPCSFSLHSASSLHLPVFFTLVFGVHVRGAERTFVVFLSSPLDFLSGRCCLETLSGGPWEGSLREEGWWPPESCGSA